MKSLFLISYDNGESYEDYRTTPILVAPTMEAAEEAKTKMEGWVSDKKAFLEKKLGDRPDFDYGERFGQWVSRREGLVAKMKPLFGEYSLIEMLGNAYNDSQGSLYITKIKSL